MFFSLNDFTKKNIIEKFVSEFNLNTTYSWLFKFSFGANQLFYMGDSGFVLEFLYIFCFVFACFN